MRTLWTAFFLFATAAALLACGSASMSDAGHVEMAEPITSVDASTDAERASDASQSAPLHDGDVASHTGGSGGEPSEAGSGGLAGNAGTGGLAGTGGSGGFVSDADVGDGGVGDGGMDGCPRCSGDTPVCDESSNTCRARVCTQAAGCSGVTPHCDEAAEGGVGVCGECLESAHCTAALPACNPKSRVCSDRFVGTWEYTSGSETFGCDGATDEDGGAADPDVTDVIGRRVNVLPSASGVEIDRSLVVESRACVLSFTVAGDTAVLSPRSCTETIPLFSLTRYMTFSDWRMTSSDGETMTLVETHTIRLSGDPLLCTATTEGTLRRVWHEVIAESEPNDDGSVGEAQNDYDVAAAEGPLDRDMFVSAAINPSGDDDTFAVTNAGSTSAQVRLETHGPSIGACGGVDTVLIVYDASGAELARNDDGYGRCSRLTITLSPGTTVYARVIAYGDDGTIDRYHFSVDFL